MRPRYAAEYSYMCGELRPGTDLKCERNAAHDGPHGTFDWYGHYVEWGGWA